MVRSTERQRLHVQSRVVAAAEALARRDHLQLAATPARLHPCQTKMSLVSGRWLRAIAASPVVDVPGGTRHDQRPDGRDLCDDERLLAHDARCSDGLASAMLFDGLADRDELRVALQQGWRDLVAHLDPPRGLGPAGRRVARSHMARTASTQRKYRSNGTSASSSSSPSHERATSIREPSRRSRQSSPPAASSLTPTADAASRNEPASRQASPVGISSVNRTWRSSRRNVPSAGTSCQNSVASRSTTAASATVQRLVADGAQRPIGDEEGHRISSGRDPAEDRMGTQMARPSRTLYQVGALVGVRGSFSHARTRSMMERFAGCSPRPESNQT